MAQTDRSGKLFEYAALYHPNPTKDQLDSGDYPESVLIVEPKRVLAVSKDHASMLAIKSIPDEYTKKLNDVEILVRPF
jgi:hypothetical protein